MSRKQSSNNYRPSIFIASSKEALKIARSVKSNFDSDADVDIWNEDVFALNNSYLNTLLNLASFYDYAIVLFTPDDITVSRNKKYKATRDNLLFEYGLFLGRIGLNRAFIITEEKVKIPSDFSGIKLATYRRRDNLTAALGNACHSIRNEIATAENLQRFSLLPSTSLAIGYYYNFIEKVAHAFQTIDKYEVFEKDSKGKKKNIQKRKVTNRAPSFTILLPKKLSDLQSQNLKTKAIGLKQIMVDTAFRPFPFYIHGDISDNSNVDFFDIPTTLLASLETINQIFDTTFLKKNNNFKRIEKREISNFEKTLRILVPDAIENKLIKFGRLI